MVTPHKWEFAPRFRRNAFGWKSDTPIQRIKEALAEIKAVAKQDPVLAADGAVLFLEKLAPALAQVDSSSGAIGSSVSRAIDALVPVIAKAKLDSIAREKWLSRLWRALQDDDMPYLERLGEQWGSLCATPEVASRWADFLIPMVSRSASADTHDYFTGTPACLSALYAAKRHEDLFALIASLESRFKWWHYRVWGARALADAGKYREAIQYAEDAKGLNAPMTAIAAFCEGLLLDFGHADEAYTRYAMQATCAMTNVATFKALTKKYPAKPHESILRDLVASQPGNEGKWFAAAKDAGCFELAITLANQSPSDPRTLTRAARDYALERPAFALAAGMTALRGIANGWGYDITSVDVHNAHVAIMAAANAGDVDQAVVNADLQALIDSDLHGSKFIGNVLGPRVAR